MSSISFSSGALLPPLTVHDFRLSLILVEPLPELLDGSANPQTPFRFLTQGELYQEQFKLALSGRHPLGLEPPWPPEKNQRFWRCYLPGATLYSPSSRQVWDSLVPLRARMPMAVRKWVRGSALLDGFYYPCGLAAVVTAHCRGSLTLDDAVELAFQLKHAGEKLPVEQQGSVSQLSMPALAQRMLEHLRSSALGAGAAPRCQREPFTLLTIIKAEPYTPFELGGNVHRALEMVTRWEHRATTVAPGAPPTPVRLHKGTPDGSIVYTGRRSRAVWLPEKFAAREKGKRSLGCYHRNLVLGSMQVDTLGSLLAAGALLIQAGRRKYEFASTHWFCIRRASEVLEGIYLGDWNTTYGSASLKVQIQQNDLESLNVVRRQVRPGLPELQ